ncbi:phosphotransferase [Streptomyces sp. MA5143a]|uniref:phosphotransferase n=1 Tax=Streptomyces sp. MA5143a TaxID=2083010 RepID=UPI000D1B8028|nr:phosphotransferase [Streptomyces sp. MA5143a]SPF06062.1 thiamine kinase [Streptomyces sp. MA5143a]
MRTGRLLGAGRTADVYELENKRPRTPQHGEAAQGAGVHGADRGADVQGVDRGADAHGAWVLRRYRDGRGDARAEAEIMEHVRAHGYPVPRVRAATRTDLILERLSGPTMLEAIAAGALPPAAAGAELARLLHALHALPPRRSTDPATRVLHLDLHPENVLLAPDGLGVIDWANAEEGPPGLDWGMSAVILAQVAADTADPRAHLAHTVLTGLLTHQSSSGPSTLTDEGLTEAITRRSKNPTMSTREIRLLNQVKELIRSAGARVGTTDS